MISINIKSTNKKELLRYLCQKAELCAFHLPVFLCENKEEEEEYKRRVSGLLDGIQPYIVAQYTASQYIGLDYGDETEIYVFKSNKFFADFLESSGGLHKWSYPKLPEDVCFLDKNRKCWLKTVTHEKECYS